MMCQESHDPAGPAWLDSQFFNWSRFICRPGVNHFEAFDFESLRWLQLHVRNARGPVIIREVGVRRRMFDWPNRPRVHCSEPALATAFRRLVEHALQQRSRDVRRRHGPRTSTI